MQWELKKELFSGAKEYSFGIGDKKLVIAVNSDGIFETNADAPAMFPLYAIATMVSSKTLPR